LNSARFWIREGPRPKREERHVVTEKINYNFLTGELFRPTSYTISPAGEEETPREIYRRKYDKIIEKIGIVPINDNIFQIDEKRENAIKRDYRLREDSIKEIVLLRKKDKIKIAQHTPEGIKILTVTRGDFKRPKTGC